MKLTTKQIEATRIMKANKETLLVGGSRSGKTFLAVRNTIIRAGNAPGSNHLIARLHFNHVKQSIWNQTLPKVKSLCFPDVIFQDNTTDWYTELTNGSKIYLAGLDDKERIEKVLGNEYSTIYLNEASQSNWNHYTILMTRLAENIGLHRRMICDCNPPNRRHWTYKYFVDRIDPEDKHKLTGDVGICYMNPIDNKENLTDDYFETLQNMSVQKRKRFLDGLWGDDSEKAIFRSQWIYDNREQLEVDKKATDMHFDKIVIGFDPATTSQTASCEHGIIVCGMITKGQDRHFYIIDDLSFQGTVNDAAVAVVDAYRKYKANQVIVETNNGGDWIPNTLYRIESAIKVEKVTATRGKAVRADPISALYERGLVHHVGMFDELEEQMITWTEESTESPDRMDAMVWGLTWLAVGADYKYKPSLSLAGVAGI